MFKIEKNKAILPMPPRINSKFGLGKHGKFFLNADHKEYKNSIKGIHLENRFQVKPKEGDVSITIVFYRKMKRGDIDGPLKLLLDSLQGVYYNNDSQINEMHVFNKTDGQWPRCEILVEFLE